MSVSAAAWLSQHRGVLDHLLRTLHSAVLGYRHNASPVALMAVKAAMNEVARLDEGVPKTVSASGESASLLAAAWIQEFHTLAKDCRDLASEGFIMPGWLELWSGQVQSLRARLTGQELDPSAGAKTEQHGSAGGGPESLVTLHQAAAMVNRSKRSLERLLAKMPAPRVQGAGGKPSEWAWSELRPWLEKEFERPLPERFPADRFRPI